MGVVDDSRGPEADPPPEVDASCVGDVRIHDESPPPEMALDEADHGTNHLGPDATPTCGRQQHEVHSATLAAVIGNVVLNKSDRAPLFLDDETLDGRTPFAEVLGTDLGVALSMTAPPLVKTGIREEPTKRLEILLRRGSETNTVTVDSRVSHRTIVLEPGSRDLPLIAGQAPSRQQL